MKIKNTPFVNVSNQFKHYEDDEYQVAHHAEDFSITVLHRRTGSSMFSSSPDGIFDTETGFRDKEGNFWLVTGGFDIREFPEMEIQEAIAHIKYNATYASKSDKPKLMTCCCCGAETPGRQWHNRDTGFSICPRCSQGEKARNQDKSILDLYGKEGYHFNVS